MRALVLSAAAVMLNIALNTTLAKYGAQAPDWLVIALWLVPLVPLGWYVYTHEKVTPKRAWLRERYNNRPKSTVAVAFATLAIIVASLTMAGRELKEHLSKQKIASAVVPVPVAPSQPAATSAPSGPATADTNPKPNPPKHHNAEPTAPPPTQPSTVISAPNGIAIGGGAVNNPTVNNNYAPPQRRLSPEFITEGTNCLSQRPGILDISAIQGNTEAWKYAQDWYTMFHNARWKIKDNIIGTFIVGGGALPTGTTGAIRGTWNEAEKRATYDHDSPEGQFVACMVGRSFPLDIVRVTPYPDLAIDTVRILVDPQPSN